MTSLPGPPRSTSRPPLTAACFCCLAAALTLDNSNPAPGPTSSTTTTTPRARLLEAIHLHKPPKRTLHQLPPTRPSHTPSLRPVIEPRSIHRFCTQADRLSSKLPGSTRRAVWAVLDPQSPPRPTASTSTISTAGTPRAQLLHRQRRPRGGLSPRLRASLLLPPRRRRQPPDGSQGRVGGRRPRRAAWPTGAGFLPPPPRTVHAVLSHTAHRRSSPPAFSFPWRHGRLGRGAMMVPLRLISPKRSGV